MSLRDGRLVRRLKDREERAFREMVEEYGDRVFSLTYRMLGSREEAEDLAQEVFITIFKSIDSFRGDSKFSTWLYRVTANHCKNRIKYLSRRHDRDRTELTDQTEATTTGGPSLASPRPPLRPDKQLEGAQMEQMLQQAIGELDEEQRILVVLRDVEDLSYEEICAITELPEGTVKSRLHRARMALRKKLLKHM
ncbi:MAG TPA: sigma-70 family RNA polymerase sigma factor [Kofleriaceae bacterium]|nr:sigma-70 family RNA polymerase sigma factor [Kofleriaceae bacterium]